MTEAEGGLSGYNVQAVVDAETQIIGAADLINHAADTPQLLAMVDEVEANMGRQSEALLADAGYFDTVPIEALQACGIRVLIPPDKMAHRLHRTGSTSCGLPSRGRRAAGADPTPLAVAGGARTVPPAGTVAGASIRASQ